MDTRDLKYDQDTVESMNDILKINLHLLPETPIRADIVDLLERYDIHEDEFIPRSLNRGFFYDIFEQRIILLDYETLIADTSFISKDDSRNVVLFESGLDRPFGEHLVLLSQDGSCVTEIVSFINQMASYSDLIMDAYQDRLDGLTDVKSNVMTRIYGRCSNQTVVNEMIKLLEVFSPEHTLFVDDNTWATATSHADDISLMVMMPGMETIPSFELTLEGNLLIGYLNLPKSIDTIKSGSLSSPVFIIDSLFLGYDDRVTIEPEGIGNHVSVTDIVSQENQGLLNYSSRVAITIIDGERHYDFSRVIGMNGIISYAVSEKLGYFVVKFFSSAEVIAYATNLNVIAYYVSIDHQMPGMLYHCTTHD